MSEPGAIEPSPVFRKRKFEGDVLEVLTKALDWLEKSDGADDALLWALRHIRDGEIFDLKPQIEVDKYIRALAWRCRELLSEAQRQGGAARAFELAIAAAEKAWTDE